MRSMHRREPCLEGRAPHGARGLKFAIQTTKKFLHKSRPTRGAWIEIDIKKAKRAKALSRPTRGAWIEIGEL